MEIKQFNVTVRRFDPSRDDAGEEFILPVDCPDAEHAASAVLSNLIAWSEKTSGSSVRSIAFQCLAVSERTS